MQLLCKLSRPNNPNPTNLNTKMGCARLSSPRFPPPNKRLYLVPKDQRTHPDSLAWKWHPSAQPLGSPRARPRSYTNTERERAPRSSRRRRGSFHRNTLIPSLSLSLFSLKCLLVVMAAIRRMATKVSKCACQRKLPYDGTTPPTPG